MALLREPLEALTAELLPSPALCPIPTYAAAPPSPQPLDANQMGGGGWGGTRYREQRRCSRAALARLDTAPLSRRFARLLRCCPSPLSRALVATLPPSPSAARCVAGACDASALYSLARRALLRMPWFGLAAALGPSALLLQRALGIRVPAATLGVLDDTVSLPRMRLPFTAGGAGAAAFGGVASPPEERLSASQIHAWRTASVTDFELYDLAIGVLSVRLRALRLPPLAMPPPGFFSGLLPPPPPPPPPTTTTTPAETAFAFVRDDGTRAGGGAAAASAASPSLAAAAASAAASAEAAAAEASRRHDRLQLQASRVFETALGGGRRMVAVPPPLRFNRTTDTLVFVHIAKCGGTSFNRRLMSLAVGGAPCVCNPPEASGTPPRTHNGHAVVQPSACACPRLPSGAKAPAQWSELAASRLGAQRQRQWRFLQAQWLVSPETTGWLGGVHAPVRVLHAYLMLAARLTSSHALASGIHFVTLLREPLSRFLSEFYETYDGWEVHHGTPPRLSQMSACSARLPEPLRTRARLGIDNTTKALYEELFPHWLACPANMASSRQTRALAYAALITQGRPASTANQQGSQRAGAGRTVPDADAALRRTVCAQLPRGAADRGCALHLARRALYQFTFVGLSSRRCAAEKLMEAQLGLRFGAPPVVVSDDSGNQDGGNRDGGRGGNGNGNGDGVDSNVRDGLRRSRRKAARKGRGGSRRGGPQGRTKGRAC